MLFLFNVTLTCSGTAARDGIQGDVGAFAEEHGVVRRIWAILDFGDVCESLALISKHIRGPFQGGRGDAALPGTAESQVRVVVGW